MSKEIIAKAKRQIDLDNSDAIMEDEEMYEYIEKLNGKNYLMK